MRTARNILFFLLTIGFLFAIFDLKVVCADLKTEITKEVTYWADKMFTVDEKGYKMFTLDIGTNKGQDYLLAKIDRKEAQGKKPVIKWE